MTTMRRRGFTYQGLTVLQQQVGDSLSPGAFAAWPATVGVGMAGGTGGAATRTYNGHLSGSFDNTGSEYVEETTSTYLSTPSTAYTLVSVAAIYDGDWIWSGKSDGMWIQSANGVATLHVVAGGTYAQFTTSIGAQGVMRAIWRYNGAGATDADRLRLNLNGVDRALTFAAGIPANVSYSVGSTLGGVPTIPRFSTVDVIENTILAQCLNDQQTAYLAAQLSAKYAPRGVHVVGDSQAAGPSMPPNQAFPTPLAQTAGVQSAGCDVLCYAVSGSTIASITAGFAAHVAPFVDPGQYQRRLLVENGTNCLGTLGLTISTAQALADLDTLIATAMAAGFTSVWAVVPLPRADVANMGVTIPQYNAKCDAYEAGLQARLGTTLEAYARPGLNPLLADPNNALYFQPDLLHMTPLGMQVYAATLYTDFSPRW